MSTPPPDGCVVYVLGAFPAPSQTFIAREIRTLLRLGLPLRVFALGREPAAVLPEEDREWAAAVRFVPDGVTWRILAAHLFFLRRAARRVRYLRALRALVGLRHRPRYLWLRALYVFWRVVPLARELQAAGGTRHVHAHFALSQAETALGLSELLGCRFSFTAHARDIYASPNALEEKMRAASFVVTCTRYNADHLRGLCPELPAGHVHVIRHGVTCGRDEHREAAGTPLLLGAGRLIAKKGFDVLIDACAVLRGRGVACDCAIAGEGPLRGALERRIRRAGLQGRVRLLGWQGPEEMERLYRRASVFSLPSRVVRGRDRDGLPNVLVEALAHGLPVVSTDVSAIPELVVDGVTGLLVAPDDPAALAAALARLLSDARLRLRLGEAGRRLVVERFDLETNTRQLAELFWPLVS